MRPSFVPPADIRALRDLTRYRRTLVEERTRAIQRLEKVMQDAGIKLTSVASTLLGKSGRAIIDALLSGVSDPVVLAELARGRLRSKIPALREALMGEFHVEHHGLLVTDARARRFPRRIRRGDRRQDRVGDHRARAGDRAAGHDPGGGPQDRHRIDRRDRRGHERLPDPRGPGVVGGNLPGQQASGGKRRSGRTRHGSVWLRTVLTEAAQAAARTKGTYLAAHHATVRGRRGRFKAIGATRHDLLIAYWHVVHDEVNYRELGADWAVRRYSPEHQLNRLIRQIERLGKTVTVTDAA